MLSKPDFTCFFNKRLVVGCGIALAMLFVLFTTSSFKKYIDRDLEAKQVNLLIRQIGHRLLLQAGDSTSRVLPVTQVKGGTFLLKFEKEFVFNHDSLMMLSHGLLPKKQFPSGYTVTVHDCNKGGIVYGFQLNNTTPDILACSGRSEPVGCYTIEFTFPDFYQNTEQNKADIGQVKSAKDLQQLDRELEAFKSTDLSDKVNQLTESAKIVPQEISPTLKEPKTKISKYPLSNVVFGGMLVLLCVAFAIGRFGKISKPVPVQDQSQAIIKESIPESAALGKFLFDVKGQRLVLGSEVISLTDKEAKVLELLHKNFGELIPRDTLMQKVWINEGVITGRSLDMFISKLRKKLSADPDLRITNIHARGYRLEIVNDFIA